MPEHVIGGGAAQLFRSRAEFREEVDHASSELIGSGSLEKMVRIAFSDPDGDLWRYSIRVGDRAIRGEEIRSL